jgi:hypothetical protein
MDDRKKRAENRTLKQKKIMTKLGVKPRNDSLFDGWSIIHMCTGIVLGWILVPFVALALMILWEPLEIFIISPYVAKFGIEFGYETLRNSLSDIVFDTAGIIVGAYLLGSIIDPPFHLF